MSVTTEVAEPALDPPVDRSGGAPPTLRSRVTNHKDLLPGVKGTSSTARRFRDLVNAFIADMGGADQCSEIKLNLLRRLASVVVQSELIEARMINGEQVDIGTLCTLASTTVRLSQRLGIERVPRDVSPSLVDYLEQQQRAAES
jgi:hypothetical protein